MLFTGVIAMDKYGVTEMLAALDISDTSTQQKWTL
jgi:hypothetical protein